MARAPPKSPMKWSATEASSSDIPAVPAGLSSILKPPKERWILLTLKLITWGYLNFQVRVPISLPLASIHDKIKEHHNWSISNLEVWKDKPLPNNILRSPDALLKDVFKIPQDDDRDYEAVIWYKFSPIQSDCPLLLSASQLPDSEPTRTTAGGQR